MYGGGTTSESNMTVSNVEVECIYRRREDNIEMIDFLHMSGGVY